MSKEKMQTALGQAVVYLAELRSIGGHSGSPVFVHLNFIDKQWELHKSPWSDTSPLLGLVHGYVHLRRDQFTAFVPSDEDEELHDKDSFEFGDSCHHASDGHSACPKPAPVGSATGGNSRRNHHSTRWDHAYIDMGCGLISRSLAGFRKFLNHAGDVFLRVVHLAGFDGREG